MLSIFDNKQYAFLSKMLDIGAQRQRAIANNIANVNTPGFKRDDIDFMAQLKDALSESGNTEALKMLEGKMVKPNETPIRRDGNNVDLNKELSELSKNAILFNMYTQMLKGHYNKLRDAMQGPAV
ncbi:MAG: flagellar basal body rod protein FlgB [Candidatus Auribacterota bacterium]|jgi:flagellar basal-body rod protein FlgB|nr:flagellar basal body rod protein FlgB [Candidatus Auribacterota bacterium]